MDNIKRSKWVRSATDVNNGGVRCADCGTEFSYYLLSQLAEEANEESQLTTFCPHCGARMEQYLY